MTLARALAFWRINGRAPSIYLGTDAPADRYGGHLRGNHHGHTIRWYLPPEKHFDEHPEFYALQKGKPSPTGLCKTNPQMRELYFNNITEAIAGGATDPDNPYIFHISDEDGPPQVCECPDCKAADARYGGANVGQMLDFLNWLAERGKGVWPPGTVLETLAYSGYETPPLTGHIREDVIVRFAPIHKCHWDRLEADLNRRDLMNLKGWLKLAKDVRLSGTTRTSTARVQSRCPGWPSRGGGTPASGRGCSGRSRSRRWPSPGCTCPSPLPSRRANATPSPPASTRSGSRTGVSVPGYLCGGNDPATGRPHSVC